MNYYAVRNKDCYLAQEGKGMEPNNLTFDRSEMQLFTDTKTAENVAIKHGLIIDDEETFIVSIDEKQLIEYLKENSIIYGTKEESDVIEQIKNIVPNEYYSNEWYQGKVNNRNIEVAINKRGYYQVRTIVNSVLISPDGTRTPNGKVYKYLRINKKNELVEA